MSPLRNPDRAAHRREMDRMAQARRRQFAAVQVLIVAIWIAIIVAAAWLFTHPEAIGSFAGRVIAAARTAS